MYTDPDGEFWHLIIGAAIGGIVNWITHGAKFNAKGLGHFGVGALAGAFGAGIGAGISSALPVASTTSGGFAAGFLGTSAATTATSSFASGALIGGGAGLSSGFTTGFGNALLDGKNFGQALGQGGIYGLIGGVSGVAIGGLWSGIDAVRDGRNFWHGGRLTTDVSMPIPQGYQNGTYDCNYEVAEQIDAYYGNNRSDTYFQSLERGQGQGLRGSEIAKMYGKAGYTPKQITIDLQNPINTTSDIANAMSNNNAVVLNYRIGIGGGYTASGQRIVYGHATAITRVRIYNNGRFIINVMNPSVGSTTRFTSLKLIHLLFSVR
jgi:hypothetical protein